jgi:phage FluMu protein Com
LALSVPLSRFTPRVGGGSAFFVRQQAHDHMKRITFSLKPDPTDISEENQEWRSYSVEAYSEVKKAWVSITDLVVFSLGIVVGTLTGYYMTAFIAAMGILFYVHYLAYFPTRCPRCKGLVTTRQVDDEQDYWHFCHDCQKCQISWECERFYRS